MNKALISVFVVITLSTTLIGVVATNTAMAQESGNATNTTEIAVEISDNLYVQSYSFDSENETVTLVLNQYDSSKPSRVQISNFLYEIDGGVKNYDTRSVLVQQETRVTFELRKIQGQMAVLVQHNQNGDILTFDESLLNFTNKYNSGQTGVLFLVGGLLGVTGVTVVALKRKWQMESEIRRRL